MSKRLEAWCFKEPDGFGHDICFQRGGGRTHRLVECAESETVISKAELRVLRAVVGAADDLLYAIGDADGPLLKGLQRALDKAKRRRK